MASKPQKKEVAELENDNALVPASNEIVSQVIQMGNGFEIAIPDDIEEVKRRLVAAEVTHVLKAVEAGVYYKHLKDQLEHGEFKAFLKSMDASSRRASEQIAVSELFKKLYLAKGRTSALLENEETHDQTSPLIETELKLSQLIELTKLPEERIASLEVDEIDKFSKMPVRMLRAEVKQICLEFNDEAKLEAENYNLKKQLEISQQNEADAINKYELEMLSKSPEKLYGHPALVANVKQLAPELSQQIHEAGLDFINLAEQISMPSLDQDQAVLAAQAIYHWLMAPYAQITKVFDRLEGKFGTGIFDDTQLTPIYEEHEWQMADARRRDMIHEHESRFHPNLTMKQAKKRGSR